MRLVERPYQHEAIHGGRGYPGVYRALREHRTTLLVLPTGTGKTVVFARVTEACVRRRRRTLILAHREELIEGAHDKLVRATTLNHLEVGVEMASHRAGDHCAVVVASVQTLQRDRLRRLRPEDFGLVVVDEAHHATAKSYRNILDHFAGCMVLGCTATPQRMDGKGLGDAFASVAYRYDLGDAIRDGYLVPIVAQHVVAADDAVDLSNVRTTAGDLNLGDLAAIMESQPVVALVARATVELVGDRQTMIFAASVRQAEETARCIDLVTGRSGSAVALDGRASSERRGAVKAGYERREFQYLVNCMLYSEGVDIPAVSAVVIARPTKSLPLFSQMVGRGTRLLGATMEESIAAGKEDLLVLDFTGRAGKHSVVGAVDLLAGAVGKRGGARARRELGLGRRVHVLAELDEEKRAERDAELQREASAARYRTVGVADVFAVLGVRPNPRRTRGPATEEQLVRLERHDVPGASAQLRAIRAGRPMVPAPIDYGLAEQLLRAIGKRHRRGLCTLRMSRVLEKAGLNPNAPYEAARRAIDGLRGNRWRPTPEMMADPALAPPQR